MAPGFCATAAEAADHGEQRLREIRSILASKRPHKAVAADATENEGVRPPIMEEGAAAARFKIKKQERTKRAPAQERPAGFALLASDCAAGTAARPSPEAAGCLAVAFSIGPEGCAAFGPPPGLPPPPLSWLARESALARAADPMQTYVISLENDVGRARRQRMQLDTDYHLVTGVPPSSVPKHVSEHWHWGRTGTERNRALQGAFAAHWKVWMQMAACGKDRGGLVLEDDCVQHRGYPRAPESYPTDGITLLGGCFKGWGNWGVGYSSFLASLAFLLVLSSQSVGIHPLPQRGDCHGGASSSQQASKQRAARDRQEMRWSMCVAYFVPPGMASRLCNHVQQAKGKSLRSPDIWLAPYTKYFLWPPAFGDQGGESQCQTHCGELGTDLYCNSEMRAAAERIGRPLPDRGCSREQVLSWQIQELRHARALARSSG
jgi:hypothetical protein